jgi:hypothetical protein
MFVAEEQCVDAGFDTARMRLVNLLHGGALITCAADCYDHGVTGLARAGPLGPAPGVSKLVGVQFGELVVRGDSVRLPFRWHATGPGGGLFPALDANLGLTALSADTTMLSLTGSYRAPAGETGAGLDPAVLRRVAAATIQAFVGRVADAIVHPSGIAAPGREGHDPFPGQPPALETL